MERSGRGQEGAFVFVGLEEIRRQLAWFGRRDGSLLFSSSLIELDHFEVESTTRLVWLEAGYSWDVCFEARAGVEWSLIALTDWGAVAAPGVFWYLACLGCRHGIVLLLCLKLVPGRSKPALNLGSRRCCWSVWVSLWRRCCHPPTSVHAVATLVLCLWLHLSPHARLRIIVRFIQFLFAAGLIRALVIVMAPIVGGRVVHGIPVQAYLLVQSRQGLPAFVKLCKSNLLYSSISYVRFILLCELFDSQLISLGHRACSYCLCLEGIHRRCALLILVDRRLQRPALILWSSSWFLSLIRLWKTWAFVDLPVFAVCEVNLSHCWKFIQCLLFQILWTCWLRCLDWLWILQCLLSVWLISKT